MGLLIKSRGADSEEMSSIVGDITIYCLSFRTKWYFNKAKLLFFIHHSRFPVTSMDLVES